MAVTPITPDMSDMRKTFFRMVFGQLQGYVCIAYMPNDFRKEFKEQFFMWPKEAEALNQFVDAHVMGYNVWFCPHLLTTTTRSKATIKMTPCAWSDLDTCEPEKLLVEPSIVVESSPGRYQGLWIFDREVEPDDAEDLSRRIAYRHADEGADRSGWDLTQLLRVPISYNYKYRDVPLVRTIDVNRNRYRLEDFEMYPAAVGHERISIPKPAEEDLPLSADDLLQQKRLSINPLVWQYYTVVPDEKSWSERLWKLHMLLFEQGYTREQVFVIAREAKCNKYARDGKPDDLLWKEVCRAFARHEYNLNIIVPRDTVDPDLITDEERRQIEGEETFIERYIEWAKGLGDAAQQYHQAGAFIALSSLLAGTVRLPTSYGTLVPNLWFMILADTTLTRKTTAMDLAMDLVMEIDQDSILATDGSIEGLLTSLGVRPGRPSIFLRDEFTGLLEQMVKRDYYAGMPELLTKLYDGKMQKRVLRKETIEVRDPILIVFAGGIRNRMTSLLSLEHVSSGFMPRFIFVTAESDVGKLKPIGPPTELSLGNREAIKNELIDLYKHYGKTTQTTTLKIGDQLVTQEQPQHYRARMTDDAWVRYNKIETGMLQTAMRSNMPEVMTPTYDRLSKSMLKAAMLIAAARQKDETIIIEERDIVRAAYYGEGWRMYGREIMNQVGTGSVEKQLSTIYLAIKRKPGVARSTLMQTYHLGARETDQAFQTLEQRGLITRARAGRTETLFAVESIAEIKEEDIPT